MLMNVFYTLNININLKDINYPYPLLITQKITLEFFTIAVKPPSPFILDNVNSLEYFDNLLLKERIYQIVITLLTGNNYINLLRKNLYSSNQMQGTKDE